MTVTTFFMWFILALLFDIILLQLKHNFYSTALPILRFTFTDIVAKYERVLYYIEKSASKIPFLILPYRYSSISYRIDNDEIVNKYKWSINPYEKTIAGILLLIKNLYIIFGVRPFYIAIAVFLLINKNLKAIYILTQIFFDNIVHTLYLLNPLEILNWVEKYKTSTIVISLLIILAYISYLRGNREKFAFESIWLDQRKESYQEVARLQKEIHTFLSKLYSEIYDNCCKLNRIIEAIDEFKYNQSDDEHLKKIEMESIIEQVTNLGDYEGIIVSIKDKLKTMEDKENKGIYMEYNVKAWDELVRLGLINSTKAHSWYSYGVLCVNKSSLQKIFNSSHSVSENNWHDIRNKVYDSWTFGISLLNSIERYQKYVNRRKKKHQQIVKKITIADFIKGSIDTVK